MRELVCYLVGGGRCSVEIVDMLGMNVDGLVCIVK